MEEWKSLDFIGYPDYQISNAGNVRSMKSGHGRTPTWRVLKPKKLTIHGKGMNPHLAVCLCEPGRKHKYVQIHRLVALAFIEKPDGCDVVNHKDENPFNNSVENLEWCTQSYNITYGTCIERMKKSMPKELISQKVKDYHKKKRDEAPFKYKATDVKTGKEFLFKYITQAKDELGLGCYQNIYDAFKRPDSMAYGYKWEKLQ